MFEIGASLTAARQARGLELRDAEQLTCLRARYLLALEREQYDLLPGRTYTRTFLRTYANALGLHADRIVAEFDEQNPDVEPPASLTPAFRRRRRNWRPVALAASALVAVAVVGWTQRPSGGASPDIRNASAALPDVPRPAASVPPVHHVKAAHKAVARPAALVVRATSGPCWVLARSGGPSGAVLAEQTLEPGEVLRLHRPHVWLRLGAPGNVSVSRGSHVLHGLPAAEPVNVTL
ncbi:MAG TPA: helix-turn-helix domain-containing protein [Gaiellaceae bacterium]|nr:helix-turn-helix domain-containing protein [Gaiellaceae bacterium]